MVVVVLSVVLLCKLLKFLLKKIIYYPELFFIHSVDDQQNKDDSDHQQLEVMNFEAAATSHSSWLRFQVPVVVPVVVDAESIEKQLPVVKYWDLNLKKRSRQHHLQAISSSSYPEEEILHVSSCIVCMNVIEGRDDVRELCNCEHVFHKDCLDAWIGQAHLTCPLCRSDLLLPATTSKNDKDGGRDPWRAERMNYLFGEDVCFTS